MKTILIAIPTNKYVEPETFKSIYDLIIPDGYRTEFQFFYGYQIVVLHVSIPTGCDYYLVYQVFEVRTRLV